MYLIAQLSKSTFLALNSLSVFVSPNFIYFTPNSNGNGSFDLILCSVTSLTRNFATSTLLIYYSILSIPKNSDIIILENIAIVRSIILILYSSVVSSTFEICSNSSRHFSQICDISGILLVRN